MLSRILEQRADRRVCFLGSLRPGKSSINTNGNSMTHLLAAAWLCVLSVRPAAAQNFLEGVVSLNLTMTKEETCIASHTA
jgi:hypothetical protein